MLSLLKYFSIVLYTSSTKYMNMIRDGNNLKNKRLRRGAKSIKKDEYKENLFSSVINARKMFDLTKEEKYFGMITDPYGILLLLDPTGVKKPTESLPDGAPYPSITCQEYVEAILDNNIDGIWSKMTTEERTYCTLWADFDNLVPTKSILHAVAKKNEVDWSSVYDTWIIQPSPEAIAFALPTHRARLENFTPAICLPYTMIHPSDLSESVRFPVCMSPNKFIDGWMHVQIHRDGDQWLCVDANDKEFKLHKGAYKVLNSIGTSFVVEGFYNPVLKQLKLWDVLCWNDIWMNRRPLSERIQLLWHFVPWNENTLIARNHEEMMTIVEEFGGQAIARNYNKTYSPIDRHTHIFIDTLTQTCILRVGGRKGGVRKSFLNTSDKKSVFAIPGEFTKEERKKEWGNYAKVNKNGDILEIATGGKADTWDTISKTFGFPLNYDKYTEGRTLPECKWIKKGGN